MDAVEVPTFHRMLTEVTNAMPRSYLDHTGSDVLLLSVYLKADIFVLERAQCKVI